MTRRRTLFSTLLLLVLVALTIALASLLDAASFAGFALRLPGSAPLAEAGRFDVSFCPGDDCKAVLLRELSAASDIKCAFFDIDDEELEAALTAKNAQVLVFEENHDGFGTKIPARSGGLMHDKFCILDEKTVITGSLNPTKGMAKNDNNLLVIDGAALAENYLQEWTELRDGGEGQVPHPRILHTDPATNRTFLVESSFCPEDACEERLLAALRMAKSSVVFMTYSFTSDAIGDLLVEKHAAGVNVTGVFEKSQESRYSEYTALKAAGLDVRLDANPSLLHHKVFVIDDEIVATGSYNPTANGNERNDENLLILHAPEIARRYRDAFERLP